MAGLNYNGQVPQLTIQLRSIQLTDWPDILAIQALCYTELEPESLVVLQSKVMLSPNSCFVAALEGEILGYCLAHPWRMHSTISLECIVKAPSHAEVIYLHDMAFSPKAQGLGLGKRVLGKLSAFCQNSGLQGISLVAVQGAQGYWQRHNFKPLPFTKALEGYPADACYMHLAVKPYDAD